VVVAPRGRGMQLATGGAVAEGEWLLFLHADTRLGRGNRHPWLAAGQNTPVRPGGAALA